MSLGLRQSKRESQTGLKRPANSPSVGATKPFSLLRRCTFAKYPVAFVLSKTFSAQSNICACVTDVLLGHGILRKNGRQ